MGWDRGVDLGWIDLRGAASDLFFSLILIHICLGVLCLFSGYGPRAFATLSALAWALINYGGFEHVLANDAAIDVSLLKYLGDSTFLQGSAMLARPISCLLMIGISSLLAWRASRNLNREMLRHRKSLWIATLMPLAVTAIVLWLWAPHLSASAWRQQHFLEQAPKRLERAKSVASAQDAPQSKDSIGPFVQLEFGRVQAALGRDLQGDRLVPIPQRKPNVLLIFVEGASGAYLPAIAEYHGIKETVKMPNLSERAVREGLWATQLVIPQRQTNRGEYAALCGDHPKLSSKQPKMSDFAIADSAFTEGRPCLPQVLKDQGYHTAYLQSAQLTFMMKDRFMARIGFDEVLGYADFPEAYERSGWGIDDRALYEQVLEKLEDYEQLDKPWFAAVLNTGTHHPYPVPKSWGSKYGKTKQSRAFAYTDDALHRLLDALKEKGIADHTLVVIISDEAQGLSNPRRTEVAQEIAKNWGPMVSFGPGITAERLDGVFVQSDTALSILDYLGLADRASHFVGRSWFRDFQGPREIPFANAHTGRQFWIDGNGNLLICVEGEAICEGHRLHSERLFSSGHTRRKIEESEIALLQAAVAATELGGAIHPLGPPVVHKPIELIDPDSRIIDLSEENRSNVVTSGQYLELEQHERLHVRWVYSLPAVEDGVEATEARIQLQIRRRIDEVFAQTAHDPLRSGEKISLDFTFSAEERLTDLDVYFTAELEEEGADPRLIVEHATAIVETSGTNEEPLKPGVEILDYRRIAAQGEQKLPWLELTPRSGDLPLHHCLQGPPELLEGRDCPEGRMIRGPRAMAPAGSVVGAHATLEAGHQSVQGHLEIVVRRLGSTRVMKGKPFQLAPGQKRDISVRHTLKRSSEKTAIRLVLHQPASGFRVSGYRMWIRPDEQAVRAGRQH